MRSLAVRGHGDRCMADSGIRVLILQRARHVRVADYGEARRRERNAAARRVRQRRLPHCSRRCAGICRSILRATALQAGAAQPDDARVVQQVGPDESRPQECRRVRRHRCRTASASGCQTKSCARAFIVEVDLMTRAKLSDERCGIVNGMRIGREDAA